MGNQLSIELEYLLASRIPPGDRWNLASSDIIQADSTIIYESLTDVLDEIHQQTGIKQFYIDAVAGTIHSTSTSTTPLSANRQYSLYGET